VTVVHERKPDDDDDHHYETTQTVGKDQRAYCNLPIGYVTAIILLLSCLVL